LKKIWGKKITKCFISQIRKKLGPCMDWHFNYWNPKNTKNYTKFVVASYKLINIKSCESSLKLLQLVHNKNAIYNYPCPGLEHVSSP